MMATIWTESKNNGEQWWPAARALASSMCNPTFTRILNALERHELDEMFEMPGDEVVAFMAAAVRLPGWDSDSRVAPHPIGFAFAGVR